MRCFLSMYVQLILRQCFSVYSIPTEFALSLHVVCKKDAFIFVYFIKVVFPPVSSINLKFLPRPQAWLTRKMYLHMRFRSSPFTGLLYMYFFHAATLCLFSQHSHFLPRCLYFRPSDIDYAHFANICLLICHLTHTTDTNSNFILGHRTWIACSPPSLAIHLTRFEFELAPQKRLQKAYSSVKRNGEKLP